MWVSKPSGSQSSALPPGSPSSSVTFHHTRTGTNRHGTRLLASCWRGVGKPSRRHHEAFCARFTNVHSDWSRKCTTDRVTVFEGGIKTNGILHGKHSIHTRPIYKMHTVMPVSRFTSQFFPQSPSSHKPLDSPSASSRLSSVLESFRMRRTSRNPCSACAEATVSHYLLPFS